MEKVAGDGVVGVIRHASGPVVTPLHSSENACNFWRTHADESGRCRDALALRVYHERNRDRDCGDVCVALDNHLPSVSAAMHLFSVWHCCEIAVA